MDKIINTVSIGFFERIRKGLKNILLGSILIIIAVIFLYRNEERSVQTAKSLAEISDSVISVSSELVDNLNDGKLVYTQGKITTNDVLSDEKFGIPDQQNIVKLIRNVEMYQRQENSQIETKDKIGGGQEQTTTYTYKKIRSKDLIDSNTFQEQDTHKNPSIMPITSQTWKISEAKVGAFDLTTEQIEKMYWTKLFAYESKYISGIKDNLKDFGIVINNNLYIHEYKKPNPAEPEIGDLRISWEQVPVDYISLIAEQYDKSFRPYQTKAGDIISMLTRGNDSARTMISNAEKVNSFTTRIFRLLGIGLIIMGFNILLSLLGTVASVIPFLGSVARTGTGIISFFLGLSLGILIIGLSRLRFRPILGTILLTISIGLIFGLKRYKKNITNGQT